MVPSGSSDNIGQLLGVTRVRMKLSASFGVESLLVFRVTQADGQVWEILGKLICKTAFVKRSQVKSHSQSGRVFDASGLGRGFREG